MLGALLLSDKALPVVLVDEGLRPEHFYNETRGRIYKAMVDLHDRGEPADLLTVKVALKTGVDAAAVEVLASAVPNVSNFRAYARRVVETAALRRKAKAAHTILEGVGTEDKDRIAEGEALLADREVVAQRYDPERWGALTIASLSATSVARWPWPFERLNQLTGGGMRRAQFTVVGAWTGVGKSVFADNVLITAAKHGARAHLYINEMSAEERGQRLAANLANVDFGRLYAGKLGESEAAKVEKWMALPPFGVTECAGWTAADIARDIVRNGWDVPCIDILHEIDYEEEGDLRRNVSLLARTAKRTGAHIIATAHLNEGRAKDAAYPRPVMRDLLGSGHIKRAADYVMFVHRKQDEEGMLEDDAQAWFAKGRNTQQGGARLRFVGNRMRFEPA